VTTGLTRRPTTRRNQRGIALVLVVMVLLCLTGLLVGYLSVSALEPQISRNLADASRARYLAEAGIERGFNVLVSTTDASNSWSGLLSGATTGRPWVAIAGLTNAAIAGAANGGTFSVTIRNDNGAADTPLTGLSSSTQPAMDTSPTTDANTTVILRSAGTFNGVTKTVEVVVRRVAVPPFAGAVNIAGRQSDTALNSAAIDIDGRDYGCTAGGTGCDTATNWTVTAEPVKYAMATPPGVQTNTGTRAEANVEQALDTPAKRDAVKGKHRATGAYTTGPEAVAADGAVTPSAMDDFVSVVAGNPATTVLQATRACPLVVTGSPSGSSNTPTVSDGCGVRTTVNLGSRQDPRLVFFRGELGLTVNHGIKGAGILVVQDGDLRNHGTLEWDGLVIVTGQNTSMAFMRDSTTVIRGAAVAHESNAGETGGYDLYVHGAIGGLSIRSSKQNVDMVQSMRSLHSITNWREI